MTQTNTKPSTTSRRRGPSLSPGTIRERRGAGGATRYQARVTEPDGVQRSIGTFATEGEARYAMARHGVTSVDGGWIPPEVAALQFGDYAREWVAKQAVTSATSTTENRESQLRNWINRAFPVPGTRRSVCLGTVPLEALTTSVIEEWLAGARQQAAADAASREESRRAKPIERQRARRQSHVEDSRACRVIPVPKQVIHALREHMEAFTEPSAGALVFATEAGTPLDPSNRRTMFERARQAAGREDMVWHDLRHTAATLPASTGASLRSLQRMLGHSTVDAALRYQHATDDQMLETAARLTARIEAVNETV